MKSPVISAVLNGLTFVGTSLLRAIDAFWAGVAAITNSVGRHSESPFTPENAKQQPLPGFPNFAPVPAVAAQPAATETTVIR